MTAVFRENSRMMVVCVVCGFFCTCHVHLALFVHLHSASCSWFCVRSLCNSINGKGNLKRCCGIQCLEHDTNFITPILQLHQFIKVWHSYDESFQSGICMNELP